LLNEIMPRKKTITKKTQKKKTAKKVEKPKKEKKPKEVKKVLKYFEGIGRRKTSVARVRLFSQGEKTFLVNGKPYEEYFPTFELREVVLSSLKKVGYLDKFRVSVKVRGGGVSAQAEAVRHGLAKALILFNPDFRKQLKRAGFLTRDSRMRERKKFGLKRARRAPQWQKR
jgi:small subunit ribosomal protein S9